jgi:hypothetical protein
MNSIVSHLAPSITNLIRADHTKVLATFHRYKADSSPGLKQALVNAVCLSVEIHAQCEEEIFYPAVSAIEPELVGKNLPEHDEMRRLIRTLRGLPPTAVQYDATFMGLMREIIHHVADEETILLPGAERALGERVHELGAAMMRRKLQLMLPRTAEIARNTAGAPKASAVVTFAGAVMAGGWLLRRALKTRLG